MLCAFILDTMWSVNGLRSLSRCWAILEQCILTVESALFLSCAMAPIDFGGHWRAETSCLT